MALRKLALAPVYLASRPVRMGSSSKYASSSTVPSHTASRVTDRCKVGCVTEAVKPLPHGSAGTEPLTRVSIRHPVVLQVLFCGEELFYSFVYTSEALHDEPSIQVCNTSSSTSYCSDYSMSSNEHCRCQDAPKLRCLST